MTKVQNNRYNSDFTSHGKKIIVHYLGNSVDVCFVAFGSYRLQQK